MPSAGRPKKSLVVNNDMGAPIVGHRRRHQLESEVRLRVMACDACRAWLRADAEGLSPVMCEELLKRARLLTGRAVEAGLLD